MSKLSEEKVARLKQAIECAVSLGEKRRYERVLAELVADNTPPKTLVACPHCNRSHWTSRLAGSFELCNGCKALVATPENKSKKT